MNVLGINYFFHDTSACIIRDGVLVAAIEEERLTRNKHTTEFPSLAVQKCLEVAGMEYSDIEHVALSVKPTLAWREKLLYALRHPRGGVELACNELGRMQRRQRALLRWWWSHWPRGKRPRLHFVEHHLAHAAGSFLVSPYEEASLLCLDGSGEWPTSLFGVGRGTKTTTFHQSLFPMSLGSCYEAVTEFCGFRPNYDEGKTMGLAPYGDPEVFRDRVERLMALDENGGIAVDLSYFEYQFGGSTRCGPRFYELFGAPRREGEPLEDRHRNAAAAFQAVLEDHALTMCRTLQKRTGCRHIVIAGGVALNSVMNGRILREANVDDVYVMPGAGDNGTSIGAAAVVYHRELGQPRGVVHDNPYLGTAYGDAEAAQAFRSAGVEAKRHDDVIALAAELLADGKIVGWFQDRMEFGPRALGNRSILANPTLADMKDTINARIKHREPFRPFAPSVVEERAEETFDIRVPAPFMLEVCSVRPDCRWRVPATTHVDGSARIHTVNRETNPKYHALITAFGKRSGVPVVLNTSLNDNGEPIAESPADAVRCFLGTGLDALIVGNQVATKQGVVRASSG